MENNGFEFSAGTHYTFQNNLRLGVNANVSFAKNKMIKVYETAATIIAPTEAERADRSEHSLVIKHL